MYCLAAYTEDKMIPAPMPTHKNDTLNTLALGVSLVAGLLTIVYLANQTHMLRLQIKKHDDETKLLMLQIAEQEKKASQPETSPARSPWNQ